MLRHTGKKRSFNHNLRLAILLSMNAGFINAAGFIAFSVLTTNITGHAALLAVNLAEGNWRIVRMVGLWLILFLSGAFVSAASIRKIGDQKPQAYIPPIFIIISVLIGILLGGKSFNHTTASTELFAGSLLFAMGMQNAMVSMISNSVVRTTHLTGMITDLGIDLARACFTKQAIEKQLKRRLLLRLNIILFFLSGGAIGALLFLKYQFHCFIIPILLLIFTLFYDYSRIRISRNIKNWYQTKHPK